MTSSEDYRREHTTVRLTDPTHDRLKAHNREGETLSGTVGRALDALARERDLPTVVTSLLEADVPPGLIEDGDEVIIFDVAEWDEDDIVQFKHDFEDEFVRGDSDTTDEA